MAGVGCESVTVQSASQSRSPFNGAIRFPFKVEFTAQQPTNLSRARPLTPDTPQFYQTAHLVLMWTAHLWKNAAQERSSKLPKALRRLKEFTKNPILHHFLIGKDHWIHLPKTARVLSPQIWTSLEQSHPICNFLPSKAPWGPYGPLGVKPLTRPIQTRGTL